MHCLFSCWVRHTSLHVNTLSSLSVHSALSLRSPASPTLSNLSAVLFPLTGGTTTSFPDLALCSARWANTHIPICTQESTHAYTHTPLPLHDNFLSILLSHTFCPQASRVSGERSSAVILIQLRPYLSSIPGCSKISKSGVCEWQDELYSAKLKCSIRSYVMKMFKHGPFLLLFLYFSLFI